jgi:hypothetical protein
VSTIPGKPRAGSAFCNQVRCRNAYADQGKAEFNEHPEYAAAGGERTGPTGKSECVCAEHANSPAERGADAEPGAWKEALCDQLRFLPWRGPEG